MQTLLYVELYDNFYIKSIELENFDNKNKSPVDFTELLLILFIWLKFIYPFLDWIERTAKRKASSSAAEFFGEREALTSPVLSVFKNLCKRGAQWKPPRTAMSKSELNISAKELLSVPLAENETIPHGLGLE